MEDFKANSKELWILLALVIVALHGLLSIEVLLVSYQLLYLVGVGFVLPASILVSAMNAPEHHAFFDHIFRNKSHYSPLRIFLCISVGSFVILSAGGFFVLTIYSLTFGGLTGLYESSHPSDFLLFWIGSNSPSAFALLSFVGIPSVTCSAGLTLSCSIYKNGKTLSWAQLIRVGFLVFAGLFAISASYDLSTSWTIPCFLAASLLGLASLTYKAPKEGDSHDL